jgi:hypothetical protein
MDSPFRSSAMVRMAVPTMDWSSAARNMPRSSPDRIVKICACEYSPDCSAFSLTTDVSSVELVRAEVVVKRGCLTGRGWAARDQT